MQIIQKPEKGFPEFYRPNLDLVPNEGKLLEGLSNIMEETEKLILSLSEAQLLFRYAPGKWSLKDIVLHLADCERVIIYRAMRIARADDTNLPGFDENLFVETARADERSIVQILNELKAYRSASLLFIDSLDDAALNRSGTANNYPLTARLLVNHLYGHHQHHLNIIRERYLN